MSESFSILLRKKSAPISGNSIKLRKNKKNLAETRALFEKPLRIKLLSNLHSFKKFKNSFSPSSTKFVRKRSKYEGFFRKIIATKPKKLPQPMSPKILQREMMDKDERKLLKNLYLDQRKYQEEITSKLSTTMTNFLKSPKKKHLF